MGKEKNCPNCMGRGKRVIITKIGLVTVPIMQNCSNCGGTGKVKE